MALAAVHPITGTDQSAGGTAAAVPYTALKVPDVQVIIIGAGFSGMAAGNRLRQRGLGDFLIFDKASGVGGTWRQNTYPGIEVDIPSVAYSYPEAPNPDWTHTFASGAELLRYAEDCADNFKLRNKLRFNTEVQHITFDEVNDLWHVRATDADGEFEMTSRFVISCHGALSTPAKPEIPGLDSFQGKIMLSQEWDHDYNITGRRTAVIGTGASGIQVIPAIAAQVRHLSVFQRTPIYVSPKTNTPVPPAVREVLRKRPSIQRIMKSSGVLFTDIAQTVAVVHHRQFPAATKIAGAIVKASMKVRISDPGLQKQLIPSYGFACKRPSFSGNYLETFDRPNVALVTSPISEVVPEGIRTADGELHALDVIVLATGFKVFDLPYAVKGSGGTDLAEYWRVGRTRAYQGSSVPEFPNLFLAPGPYGVIGFNWFDTIKLCTGHAVDMVCEAMIRSATRVEVKQEAFEEFFNQASAATENTVFKSGDCGGSNTYYLDAHGDTPFLRPFSILRSNLQVRRAPKGYDYSRRLPDTAERVEL